MRPPALESPSLTGSPAGAYANRITCPVGESAMNRNLWVVFALMVVLGGAVWARADAEKEEKDKGGEKDPAPAKTADGKVELCGEYAEMAKIGDLNEEQKKRLLGVQKSRESALKKFDESAKKTREAIEKKLGKVNKKDKKTRESLEKQLEKLDQQRKEIIAGAFKKALAALTPEQRAKYNGEKLWDVVNRELSFLGLTDEQQVQAKGICARVGKAVTTDITQNEAVKNTAVKQIYSGVMTKEQKKEYAKAKQEEEDKKKKKKRS
jgi:Spy/CpxP family protein refolding chaperone